MFKRKPEIKNIAPLRSSDRRRLADQIIRDYGISLPPHQSHPADDDHAPDNAQAAVTLSELRNSLLPESTASARFTTSASSGSVYIGAYSGQDERILWFQYGKSQRLVPTVYALWMNPDLVPLLHTPDFVVEEKLKNGSDLMIPGLFKPRETSWDARAKTGSVAAVAGIQKDTVPLWVGTCEVDICRLGSDVRVQKGVAVKALHWAGDELWAWRSIGSGGDEPPDGLDWPGLTGSLAADIGNVALATDDPETGGGAVLAEAEVDDAENEEAEPPTTDEVNEAFQQAFLFAVQKAKASNKGPHYGLNFPIQPSFLISNLVQPNLRNQNHHYNIKKTSWKNAKKFIKHLDKKGLVKSKDRNGGETVILDIDFDDEQVTAFRPYKLPTPKASSAGATASRDQFGDNSSSRDPSIGQKLTIQTVYRPSPKLVPTLVPSKTEFYSAQQISDALKTYIDNNPELGGKSSSSITLDPFLANNVLGSNPAHDDSRILAAGRIGRSALQRRVLDDSRLCQPFHAIARNQQPADKPRSGPPPQIQVTIEKRTGTKVVTKVSNLENFFIDPHLLAPELQKKCAGSASVSQVSGGKPGLLEVVVQGDQRKVLVGEILACRGVEARWVNIVDKVKPKKK
ncbi:hypothetical protein GGR56DRAFT_150539 [Xylariaceae sp. FL0804]|nr:hypothetical protein GGR56DRAFT_150539 [Xylariaceae sp. FL0804]